MNLTTEDYEVCREYCFRKSWRLRLMPQSSRRLIRRGLALLSPLESDEQNREWLTSQLTIYVRTRYIGNPILILILLKIILPIIIRLLLKWWANHQKARSCPCPTN